MSCIGFLISMFGTRMCGQTLLFIVIANCAILTRRLESTAVIPWGGSVWFLGKVLAQKMQLQHRMYCMKGTWNATIYKYGLLLSAMV